MSLSFDGNDLLNVNIGPTWFEVIPFGDKQSLAYLEGISGPCLRGALR